MNNATNAILLNKQKEDFEYARAIIENMYRTQSSKTTENKNTIEAVKNEGKIEYSKDTVTNSRKRSLFFNGDAYFRRCCRIIFCKFTFMEINFPYTVWIVF